MSVIRMQKVAVVAHVSKREEVIDVLHRGGLMQVSEMPDASEIRLESLPFHLAEIEHVLSLLTPLASKKVRAEMARTVDDQSILAAGTDARVQATINDVHRLEHERASLKQQLSELEHGRLPSAGQVNDLDEGVYFTGAIHEDLTKIRAGERAGEELAVQVESRTKEVHERLATIHATLVELSLHLPLLSRARQALIWLNQAEAARQAMKHTKSTVTLFGWIAKHLFPALERTLHHVSPATALIAVDPLPGEEAPVALKNPSWLKPFESVTMLYGLPKPSEVDPTPLLAPFFILFFGLCLTDAAYGLVLAAAMGVYLWRKRLTVEQAPLWWLLCIGGLATFFISIPFGGWFGLSPDQAPAFMVESREGGTLWFKGQIWNLGVTQGIQFFQYLALALGITHLSFGFFMAGYTKWRVGNYEEAWWVDWTTLVLIATVFAYFFVSPASQEWALYALYGAIALVIWGKGHGSAWYLRPIMGLLGLLNLAMSMLSNTLSYLRLLALGLVTGALAMAVNLVAQQIGALFPAPIGTIVMVCIYLGGHTANLALNVLGAFIHSGRLQFVEFFGNFFEGGGRPFVPFKRSTSPLS